MLPPLPTPQEREERAIHEQLMLHLHMAHDLLIRNSPFLYGLPNGPTYAVTKGFLKSVIRNTERLMKPQEPHGLDIPLGTPSSSMLMLTPAPISDETIISPLEVSSSSDVYYKMDNDGGRHNGTNADTPEGHGVPADEAQAEGTS